MVASKSDIGENPPALVCRTRYLVLADDQTDGLSWTRE